MFFFTHPVRGGQHRSISLQYIICSFSTTHPTAVLLNPIFAWCHCTLFYLLKVAAISILGSLHSCFLGSLLLRLGPTLSPRKGIKMWGQLVLCCADFMQLIFILETIMFYAVNTDYLFCQLGYKLF